MKCHMCNDQGKEGGCPRCGMFPRQALALKTVSSVQSTEIVPVTYQGKLWSKPEGVTELSFQEFDNTLEKVHNFFLSGRLPTFSMFIAAPAKYGKVAYGFSCMQTAAAQGYSVAPMMSTSEWRRLYKTSQVNPFFKMYEKYTWDTLIRVEVVFITVDHGDERYDDIILLKDILDTRGRMGLPTFILSDFKLTELTPRWKSEAYSLIYNLDKKCDRYRYPIVLHRFKE